MKITALFLKQNVRNVKCFNSIYNLGNDYYSVKWKLVKKYKCK